MFDKRLHDYFEPSDTPRSRALLERIGAAARAENSAAAARLTAIGELFEDRRRERGETADWAVDTWAAVGAEVAAARRVSLAKASSYMNYGLAMQRLPAVAAVFATGDIDLQMFQMIVYRKALITDEQAMAEVDRRIAARAARWPSMTRGGWQPRSTASWPASTATRCAGSATVPANARSPSGTPRTAAPT